MLFCYLENSKTVLSVVLCVCVTASVHLDLHLSALSRPSVEILRCIIKNKIIYLFLMFFLCISANFLAKLCGDRPLGNEYTGRSLNVVFHTDSNVQETGFNITYK
jgi:hypothetical protein